MRCRECGRDYPVEPLNVCEFCFGPLEVNYDYDSIARSVTRGSIEKGPATMWRYDDFLPVEGKDAVDIGTGFTPLVRAKNLGRMLGLDRLYIKNDAVHPIINTPSGGDHAQHEDKIRTMALENNITLITTIAGAQASAHGIAALRDHKITVSALQDYYDTASR